MDPIVLQTQISSSHTTNILLFSLILAFAFCLFISSKFNIVIGIAILLLTLLIYILMMNLGNNMAIPYALQ